MCVLLLGSRQTSQFVLFRVEFQNGAYERAANWRHRIHFQRAARTLPIALTGIPVSPSNFG